MTTETKHKPATPLPITSACDEEFRANAEEGRKYREEQRRAHGYPKLDIPDFDALLLSLGERKS